jgi:tRNA pseudouridine65 synthase
VAINKPHGLLVHRSRIARDAEEFALQLLRDQIGEKVYPAHRLDRKTSGILLFAKSKDWNSYLQEQFREQKVEKTYHAIVRGFTPQNGSIDYALKNEDKVQEAQTDYRTLAQYELPLPFGKFSTSRYSLVELKPHQGRFHQLRKHMAHIFHPIIGDRPHGCNKQNKLWKERFGMTNMLLHALELSLDLPDGSQLTIKAPYSPTFSEVLNIFEGHQHKKDVL